MHRSGHNGRSGRETSAPVALDCELEARIRAGFDRQPFMKTIGAELGVLGPGEASIILPYSPSLGQQAGHLHAVVTTAIADTACGYAVRTLFSGIAGVVSVEFKINLLEPAKGDRFIAEAKVLKAGHRLVVCRVDVWACEGDAKKRIAAMQATMMPVK
jgi:uncharacterized protein (TIGR00369 family)